MPYSISDNEIHALAKVMTSAHETIQPIALVVDFTFWSLILEACGGADPSDSIGFDSSLPGLVLLRRERTSILLWRETACMDLQQHRTRPLLLALMAQKVGIQGILVLSTGNPLQNDEAGSGYFFVTDHVNLLGDSPLLGFSMEDGRIPFLDVAGIYSTALGQSVKALFQAMNIALTEATYIATSENLRQTAQQSCASKTSQGSWTPLPRTWQA